jgi:hypothetical protein
MQSFERTCQALGQVEPVEIDGCNSVTTIASSVSHTVFEMTNICTVNGGLVALRR